MSGDKLSKPLVLRLYFTLAVLEGLAALVYILRLPTDPSSAWLFGYSRIRLLMAASVLLAAAVFLVPAVKSWRNRTWLDGLIRRLDAFLARNRFWLPLVVLSILALVLGRVFAVWMTAVSTDQFLAAYLIRLTPYVYWLVALAAQTLVALPFLGYFGAHTHRLLSDRKIILVAFLTLGFFLALWGWMNWTRLGLDPQPNAWGHPHAPLLFWQVVFAWGVGFAFLVLSFVGVRIAARMPWLEKFTRPDIFVALLLWLVTAWIWFSAPLLPNGYALEPVGPNYEYYPFVDAGHHDVVAQNLLIGDGYEVEANPVVRRPMYTLFLAILHRLTGQRYQDVVGLQVILLAVFPALVYLLGTALHHRATGMIAAVLVLLRELNAYQLSDDFGVVSHTKTLMTDFPTGVGIAFLLLLVLLWLQRPGRRWALLLPAGGLVGFLMLVRPQVVVFAPVLLFLVGWVYSISQNTPQLVAAMNGRNRRFRRAKPARNILANPYPRRTKSWIPRCL